MQGSHPYSPYAMPSPNGTAEVSVSIGYLFWVVGYIILKPSSPSHKILLVFLQKIIKHAWSILYNQTVPFLTSKLKSIECISLSRCIFCISRMGWNNVLATTIRLFLTKSILNCSICAIHYDQFVILFIYLFFLFQVPAAGGRELEGKSGEQKKSPLKRSKGSLGSLGMLTGKGNETGKASANGGISQR